MRRKRRNSSSAEEAEVDMTPMLDVTFIMLIFFIVTISFVHVSGIDVSRPSNAPSQSQPNKNKPIVIQIRANGSIVMDGRTIDLTSIQDNVQKGLATNDKATVIVIANGQAKAGLMVTAIDQARAAGAKKVSIATTNTKG